jgi:hypothetical protein
MRGFTIAILFSALLAGGASDTGPGGGGGGAGGGSGGGAGGGGGSVEPPDGAICNASNACPDGQFCFNGICAIGCNSDGDCASNQYCDTDFDRLCHNRTVTTCPDTPCAEGQECEDGFCSTPPEEVTCTPRFDGGDDGCDDYSLCRPLDEDSTACYSFPACDENAECPVGLVGAVCNTGIIPNKAAFCMTGACETADNCPADWACVKTDTAPIGDCSDGTVGAPCLEDMDCVDPLTCNLPFPGEPGFCQMGFEPPFPTF